MNGQGQFYAFLVCVCCGTAGGLLYDGVCALRSPFCLGRKRGAAFVCILTDLCFGALFAFLLLAAGVALRLPALRAYLAAGCAAGFWLYRKSFHKIVAFFGKRMYNKVKQMQRGRRKCPHKETRVSPKKR